jgi:NADP-dependent 3-hydroxy acid dehydrogenase YdfG
VAIASALAKEGARIIVNGRTLERVKEAVQQIKSRGAKAMLGFVIDSLE